MLTVRSTMFFPDSGVVSVVAVMRMAASLRWQQSERKLHGCKVLWVEAQQIAACNALHSAEAWLARWFAGWYRVEQFEPNRAGSARAVSSTPAGSGHSPAAGDVVVLASGRR
jgi:hypothetical protein